MPETNEKDAYRAFDSVRKVAEIWGISREAFVADWLGHVNGEKTGLEREPAFSFQRKETR